MVRSGPTILMPSLSVSILAIRNGLTFWTFSGKSNISESHKKGEMTEQIRKELIQIVSQTNSPIDQLWVGVLSSNIDLVRSNLSTIPDNYQSPNPLETQVPEAHIMHGFTPIHVAAYIGCEPTIRLMLNVYPTMAKMVDSAGLTPLHYCAISPNSNHLLSSFIEFSDINARNAQGQGSTKYF